MTSDGSDDVSQTGEVDSGEFEGDGDDEFGSEDGDEFEDGDGGDANSDGE